MRCREAADPAGSVTLWSGRSSPRQVPDGDGHESRPGTGKRTARSRCRQAGPHAPFRPIHSEEEVAQRRKGRPWHRISHRLPRPLATTGAPRIRMTRNAGMTHNYRWRWLANSAPRLRKRKHREPREKSLNWSAASRSGTPVMTTWPVVGAGRGFDPSRGAHVTGKGECGRFWSRCGSGGTSSACRHQRSYLRRSRHGRRRDRRPTASVRGGARLGIDWGLEHGHERDHPSAPSSLNSQGSGVSASLAWREPDKTRADATRAWTAVTQSPRRTGAGLPDMT